MEEKKNKSKLMIIIFIAIVIIAVVGIVVFMNKDKGTPEETKQESKIPEITYKVGETVKTDLVEFTLNDSSLAISLNNSASNDYENFLKPKEYDQNEHNNMYVAKKGTTYVYMDITAKNIAERTGAVNLASNLVNEKGDYQNFTTITYKDKTHTGGFNPTLTKILSSVYPDKNYTGKWYENGNIYDALYETDIRQYRLKQTLEFETDSLKDKYYITFNLPVIKNDRNYTTKPFTYVINAES